ncbi:MAG: AAA family ATPase [Gemmatimonadota bacterium]|nr:AAA family ATPase [Gemmatimonadota bacterium]MDQ8147694.1 AAA family ATPase [Gemmatimonadota bacterium]
MTRIRRLEIENFRGIRSLDWTPEPGLNCLLGPGDIGKSTVLDAIDLCLGARRAIGFTDADFFDLDVSRPIRIAATIGELPAELHDIDAFGQYVRGFDTDTRTLADEPGVGLETVLTLQLLVDDSLDPGWTLYSDRASSLGHSRGIPWGIRTKLGPIRIGAGGSSQFAWRQGSVLSRLTSDVPDASAALASAAREARKAFGDQTAPELQSTLDAIAAQGVRLGLKTGDGLKAMLDADSISLGRGTIALHTSKGIPLQCLGAGSVRLLTAGMQQTLGGGSCMIIADEVEHGLEPYRIARLLDTLGAKATHPSAQVFLTTHSPVVIRELSGGALSILRRSADESHVCVPVGTAGTIQGTARTFPEALLARAVVICEGATEVGMLRGLDQFEDTQERPTLTSAGVVYIDGNGHDRIVGRAQALQALGFATAILRDSDVASAPANEDAYIAAGGRVFRWPDGQSTEQALFAELTEEAAARLLAHAVEFVSEATVDAHIRTKSDGRLTLAACRVAMSDEVRAVLGLAAKVDKGWFKTVGQMEIAAREVIGPALVASASQIRETVEALRAWARDVAV